MAATTEERYSYSRRGRRTYDDDEDDDRAKQREQRRTRRQQRDDDDEDDTRSSRRNRRRDEEEEEEDDDRPRRGRRGRDDEEEERSSKSSIQVKTTVSTSSKSARPGATLGAMAEGKRKRVQQAIIDSMFKYAESKYGKKRKHKPGKGRTPKEEYELYMKSVKARVKTADDKLQTLLKQQADIDDKVKKAEDEEKKQSKVMREAEREMDNAESEGRDPVPPSTWVPPPMPNQAGNKKAKANFANLVMSASSASWDEKFAAMKAKKGEEKQPDWMKKSSSRKRDDLLLSVGKKRPEKSKKDHHEPAWGSVGLKKSERGEKKEIHPHHVEKTKPEWSKKALHHEAEEKEKEGEGRRQRRNRRRGGDDSD